MLNRPTRLRILAACFLLLCLFAAWPPREATAQPTAFTYQGQLKDAGSPANGNYDLSFTLWDDPAAGNLIAGPIDLLSVPVANGLFTSELDFGPVFGGAPLWLEISVNAAPLAPRQSITSAPYCQTAGYAQSSNVANYSYAPWVPSGADLFFNSGRVGLGLTDPTYTLDVNASNGIRLGLQANGGGALVLFDWVAARFAAKRRDDAP